MSGSQLTYGRLRTGKAPHSGSFEGTAIFDSATCSIDDSLGEPRHDLIVESEFRVSRHMAM
jgi:hypothetical protein